MMRETALKPVEPVKLDAGRLADLNARLGPGEAEETLCRAMEAMALILQTLERDWRLGATDRVITGCITVARLAEDMGMTQMERVSRDVARTAQLGEEVALSATISRLMRLGERSLYALWERDNASL